MVFKIKPILTARQLRRAKWTCAFAASMLTFLGILSNFVDAADDEAPPKITWQKEQWYSMDVQEYPRGRIVYFSKNTEVCQSSLLIPGVATLSRGMLAVAYGLCLCYLFVGISIVAEIFMEAIEKITAKQVIVTVKDEAGNEKQRKILFWNATVANLTLMALGSSAPEILLAVLETVTSLGKCPGELGASTIVGSAAFNLLVISGISIYAVSAENDNDDDRDEEMEKGVKRIYDMRVFAITCTSSLWAYIWLWIVLMDQYVKVWEGVLTFVFFFILIVLAFGADKVTAREAEKKKGTDAKDDIPVIEYSAYEIYKDLLIEQRGGAPQDEQSVQKRDKMKRFLKQTMNTEQIDKVSLDELKKIVEGEGMISRIKYRKQINTFMTGKRPVIAKYEKMKLEHAHADQLDENVKNDDFGFVCLHYSVSESSGKLAIQVINKKRDVGRVRVATVDGDAKAGEDYDGYDGVLEFAKGEYSKPIEVGIKDDDNWEPDEDFFVQLFNPDTNGELVGQDTKTRVTIIDDDKPGQICFQDAKAQKVAPTDDYCEIVIIRKNGSDGKVTVDYETIQLGNQDHVAQDGVHYLGCKGTLTFDDKETQKVVKIKIVQQEENDEEYSDNAFGFQLSNVSPAGAKLSKKSFNMINIVTDLEQKKKADAYAQLIAKLDQEEEKTWGSQFVTACMLHPTKGEDGEIQDIEAMDGVMHFLTIGWKLFFAIIPPAHMCGGIPCFFISLAVIGIVTFVVGEFANLFGCVLGIKPGVTAITFVALGTSLPDTFASMQAAQQEKYADAAVGNVTGSNSVNVFLGLGLPWVIATAYESASNPDGQGYFVPAGSLGFSVVVFIACALLCIACLLIRRAKVGGELGGTKNGRTASLIFLSSLWFIYIIMSILQAYKVGGKSAWEGLKFGIQDGVYCPYPE